jgi:DNA modification methylase
VVVEDLLNEIKQDEGELDAYLESLAKDTGAVIGDEPPEDQGAQIDKAEELRVKWGVELEQLWQLGEHRLICGDCTDKVIVDRVMDGEKVGAVVTDPPYGINREGIENDNPEGLQKLFENCLSVMPIENAVIIAFQSPRLFPVWLDALRKAGQKFERALWFYDETDITFPWRGWLMTSQIALVSSIGNPKWSKDKYHHDCYIVKTAGKQDDSGGHTTAKPLDVVEDLVLHTSNIVYDPFLGSGTTLIACERLSRKCRAVEISPAYCAVAIQRWVDMTGQEPVKLTP